MGLKDSQGILQESQEGILGVVRSYYADLFREKGLDKKKMAQFLEAVPGPVVDNLDFSPLTADITVEEVREAIDKLRQKKAPGPDGITAEFYKKFKELLAPILVDVFKSCLEKRLMPPSMRVSSLVLLFKGREPNDIKNWRPIALLNVDRKILAKILFSRLKCFSPALLTDCQYGTVKGRNIYGALISLREAFERCKVLRHGKYMVSLDQAKAFDRVDHGYLWATLLKYGIPRLFVDWLRTLYWKAESFPLINGWQGGTFGVEAGVRQGCPLSPLLYVFAIDPFLRSLQECDFRGVPVPHASALSVFAYADDVTVVVSTSHEAQLLAASIGTYSEASGSLVNFEKSEALWTLQGDPDFDLPQFAKASSCLKILGVKFGREDNARLNWEEKLDAGNARVQRWKNCKLTYRERVKMLKTYLIPIFLYVSMVFPLPESFSVRLFSLFFQLFWGNRLNPIKRGVTYLLNKEGGLNMINPKVFFDSLFLKVNFGCLDSDVGPPWVNSVRAWILPRAESWMRGGSLKRKRCTQGYLPPYLDSALKSLRRWGIEKSYLEKSPRKLLYRRICRTFFCSPLVLRDCTTAVMEESLKLLNSPRLPSKFHDIAWLSLHGKMYVRGNMKGLAASERICPLGCNQEESMEHFLVDCWGSREVWKEVAAGVGIQRLENLSCSDRLYGVPPTIHGVDRGTMYIIITVVKYYQWHARTKVAMHNEQFISSKIAGLVLSELRWIKGLEIRKCWRSIDLWKGVLL